MNWPAKWAGKTWTGTCRETVARATWTLTEQDLRALLDAMPDRTAMLAALGVGSFTDSKADRALQILRKAGLAEYRGKAGWHRVEDAP